MMSGVLEMSLRIKNLPIGVNGLDHQVEELFGFSLEFAGFY